MKYFLLIIGGIVLLITLRQRTKNEHKPLAAKTIPKVQFLEEKPTNTDDLDLRASQAKRAREVYKNAAKLGIKSLRPERNIGKIVFDIKYQPLGRACLVGDLDLIAKEFGWDTKLRFQLEGKNGHLKIKSKPIRTKDLKKTFIWPIEIKEPEGSKFLQLSLCLASEKSCQSLPPFSYKGVDHFLKKKTKKESRSSIFFSQQLRVDKYGVHIFDSARKNKPRDYESYAVSVDGKRPDYSIYKKMIKRNREIGSLPVRVEPNAMIINMFYKDGCI